MKRFIQKFNKYGGMSLIKQYYKAGVLFFAVTEMFRLGSSKTSLELLRAGVQLKIQKRLHKRYEYVLKNIDKKKIENMEHKSSGNIWICWLQGIENAPEIVRKCVDSIKENFKNRNIVFLTEENYKDYITFPAYIQKKIDSGVISKTHFSDLLRLELLLTYGGIWIDATVFMTGSNISKMITDADLFMFQELKPGRDGHCMPMSSWFIISKTNNLILYTTRELLYEYWKRNDSMIDYFLIHHFLNISRLHFEEEWNKIPKYSNGDAHLLLLELFEEYDEERFNEMKRITSVHKLSYKFTEEQMNKKGTYYDRLFALNN